MSKQPAIGKKEAIGNRQSAIGESQETCHATLSARNAARHSLPIADRLLPIAGFHVANLCTVTPHGPSVTSLPLAESVLISVGRFALEGESEKRIWPTFALAARVPRCSFQGGTCIQ
jgi:hypothetical protein